MADSKLTIVSDASPLIALTQVGILDRLEPLFDDMFIPEAVRREIDRTVLPPVWIITRSLSEPLHPRLIETKLDPGEAETIALAIELGNLSVLIDERAGRAMARRLGLPVIGTLGLLLLGKEAGLLAQIRPTIEHLRNTNFFLSPEVVQEVLDLANEGDEIV